MTEANVLNLLQKLGVNKHRVNSKRTHILASCPLANKTHEKGTDIKPSFSVKLDNFGKSVCHCFGCGFSGTMMQLARECGSKDAEDFVWAHEEWPDKDKNPYSRKEEPLRDGQFGRFVNLTSPQWFLREKKELHVMEAAPHDPLEEFDEDKVSVLDWDLVNRYLKSIPQYVINRGISIETAKKWRLGYNKGFMRVVMPIIDRRNRLVGYALRSVGEPKGDLPKFLFNTGLMKMYFLYGENLIDPERGDIILVEGQFDALKVYQAGYNVMAILGSELSEVQAMKITELLPIGKKVILIMDGDKAGRRAAEKAFEKLKDRVPVLRRDLPDGKDPGMLTEKQIQDVVRINECK